MNGRERRLDPIVVFESGVLFVTLGSPVGRFAMKAAEESGISLSPRLENSSLLALAALNLALSAISRNRHVKRPATLGATLCAVLFAARGTTSGFATTKRAVGRRGEERRGEKRSAEEGKRKKERERGGGSRKDGEKTKVRENEDGRREPSFEKSLMESLILWRGGARARARARSECTVINDRSDGVRP